MDSQRGSQVAQLQAIGLPLSSMGGFAQSQASPAQVQS